MSDIYLGKIVGAGGFQKPLVIKKLLPRYSAKSRFVRRFVNEAKTLARLNHANIVQVLDMGVIDGEYYIALEYIEGRNAAYILSKATRTGHQPSLEFSLHVIVEVCKGLAYAHRRKRPDGENLMLVHQDINSFNVMVSYEAEVKIIDFGIARMFLDKDGLEGLPIAGKLLYFSPEQLQKKPIDRRVDIYGAGVLLYELLTGQRLVTHQENVGATIRSILDLDVKSKVESNDHIIPELRPVLIKAMAFEPEDRYPWMEDMLDDLRDVLRRCSLGFNCSGFARYMKEQFQREIVLDRQRMRRLLGEKVPPRRRSWSFPARSHLIDSWKEIDLVEAVASFGSAPDLEADQDDAPTQPLIGPRPLVVGSGETIYCLGDVANDVYLIERGRVRTFLSVGTKRQIVAVHKKGEFFGETALLDGQRRTESAEAEEDCRLICLDRDSFAKLIGPELAGRIILGLLGKLRDIDLIVETSLVEDQLFKLIQVLLSHHRRSGPREGRQVDVSWIEAIFPPEGQDQIKKYLNKLEALNVLSINDQSVQIVDLPKLENVMNVLAGHGKLSFRL